MRKAFKQEMVISRSDLVAMLIASLDEKILNIDFSDEDGLRRKITGTQIGRQ